MWTGIEACASTLCASLPCYYPLMSQIALGFETLMASLFSVFSNSTAGYSRSRSRSGKSAKNQHPWQEASSEENINSRSEYVKTVIEAGVRRDSASELEMGKIKVETTMQ